MNSEELRVLNLNQLHTVKTCSECPEYVKGSHCVSGFAPESTSFVCYGR